MLLLLLIDAPAPTAEPRAATERNRYQRGRTAGSWGYRAGRCSPRPAVDRCIAAVISDPRSGGGAAPANMCHGVANTLRSFLTAQSDTHRVVAGLRDELDGGEPTGFQPAEVGELKVRISTMVVHAQRSAS
jgi:hypothetical protein